MRSRHGCFDLPRPTLPIFYVANKPLDVVEKPSVQLWVVPLADCCAGEAPCGLFFWFTKEKSMIVFSTRVCFFTRVGFGFPRVGKATVGVISWVWLTVPGCGGSFSPSVVDHFPWVWWLNFPRCGGSIVGVWSRVTVSGPPCALGAPCCCCSAAAVAVPANVAAAVTAVAASPDRHLRDSSNGAPPPCETTLFLEPNDHGRLQVQRVTKSCQVCMWKCTLEAWPACLSLVCWCDQSSENPPKKKTTAKTGHHGRAWPEAKRVDREIEHTQQSAGTTMTRSQDKPT